MINARDLLRFADREERRRRKALRRLPPFVWSAGLAMLFSSEIARLLGAFGGTEDVLGAARTWSTVTVLCHLAVFLLTPHRTFWRPDSSLLSRLSVPGKTLFRAAWARTFRATLLVSVPCAAALIPTVIWGPSYLARRQALLLMSAFGIAAYLGPAIVLLAGHTAASDRARSLLESFGGEFQAPSYTWFGALPGLVGAGFIVTFVAGHNWTVTPTGTEVPLLLVSVFALSVIALRLAVHRADSVMPGALREVAAMDQERLAHVDRSTPSLLERAMASAAGAGSVVFEKDAALLRRRFPAAYLLWFGCALTLWIASAVDGGDLKPTYLVLLSVFAVHAVVMARRLLAKPTEHLRLMHSSAIPGHIWRRSKRLYAGARVVLFFGACGGPFIATRTTPAVAAIWVGSIALVTLAGTTLSIGQKNA